jgi:hypothetical protein
MKQVIFRYGLLAALAILVLSAIQFFIVMPNVSFDTAEVAGYLTMILSMIFVFMGIRYYRDHVNNGSLSFVQGLKVGTLIVLIPAVFFGLFDILYTQVLHPTWLEEYYTHAAAKIKASAPADQLEAGLQKLQKDKELFGNPAFQFLIMAATVLIIGFIATIISSLTLMKKKKAVIA